MAQSEFKPFEILDKQVRRQAGGWSGSKENLSKIFNNERIRLGAEFENEMWKYLDNDVEKHYWIATFLDSDSYLHGSPALPELSIAIRQKGIELVEGRNDEESLGRKYQLSFLSAITSESIRKREQALGYKKQAEMLFKERPDLSIYKPILSEYKRCIYENIGQDTSQCKKTDVKNVPITQISGGIVNGKALDLPRPKYPKAAKKNKIEGEIRVRVLIDENGNVLSAEALNGHPELQNAAVEAARQAKFARTTLSGKPVKVSGVIIYIFNR